MRWHDPIVDEIHQIRQTIMKEHDNDLHKLFDRLRANQQTSDRKVVKQPVVSLEQDSQNIHR